MPCITKEEAQEQHHGRLRREQSSPVEEAVKEDVDREIPLNIMTTSGESIPAEEAVKEDVDREIPLSIMTTSGESIPAEEAVKEDVDREIPLNIMTTSGESSPAEEAVTKLDSVTIIKAKLQQAGDIRRRAPIPRVHASVRAENSHAYDPQMVLIGPFHHGKSGMEEMEKLKQRFMNDLLHRSNNNSVESYVHVVQAIAPLARAQYSADITMFDEDFVAMMVLDGCFVVECLVKRMLGRLEEESNCNTTLLRNDLLLIENQIPFCVVEALFNASVIDWGDSTGSTALTDLAAHFLEIKKMPASPPNGFHHLLHLFHQSHNSNLAPASQPKPNPIYHSLSKLMAMVSSIFYCLLYLVLMYRWPRLSPSNSAQRETFPQMIPCATELREAGINIKKKHFDEETEACLLNVTFQDGTLEIPLLSVESSTNSTFRNLLAFEQWFTDVGNDFTSYIIFLHNLIKTAADVAVLRRCGVMEIKQGSDKEVAKMFNTIYKKSFFNYQSHYLNKVFKDVKCYSESPRHRWRANLVHDYLNSPWAVIARVVASLLLFFTGLQVIFAVLSYFRPPKP